ncbi:KH domain-containing, RNA-binding, signal transduction-associated protein 3 isoform X2 [Eupeodes corollae]|uniref:KH domain-containing, RNA-binding, signal transduction-associated protein 3 isoform X2 n=1 Tax=Eupeodes corollae TaxID=290404 RepID=UPI002493940C|nr:KH domain-containing, RNA-binding, signal transduction-associated protein 3 isoform X2 [Eupeodes corollae]
MSDMEVEGNGIEIDDHNENGRVRLNEMATKYIQDLMGEKSRMENQYPLAQKLIDDALEKVHTTGRIPTREQYADVYQQKTIKLSQKVHVPIKDKKFNYVGKLLGPKGNSLRRLQEETQCKIVILGRFSMKDRAREEELRNSTDTKYAHLNLPLHVEISTIAPPAEAYARVAYALAEIRKYLIPDKHDDIRQEQLRELMEDPEAAKKIAQRAQLAAANVKPQYQQQTMHQNYNKPRYSTENGSTSGGGYPKQQQPPSQLQQPYYGGGGYQQKTYASANSRNYNPNNRRT